MACDYEINDNRFDFERSVANVCQNMTHHFVIDSIYKAKTTKKTAHADSLWQIHRRSSIEPSAFVPSPSRSLATE